MNETNYFVIYFIFRSGSFLRVYRSRIYDGGLSMMPIMATIAKMHYWFTISWSLIGTILAIPTFLTFAKVWQPTFEYLGVPMLLVYFGVPAFGLVGCILLGYLMIRYDYQGKYARYASNTNTDWAQMYKNINWIRNKLEQEKP